jgi:thymidylate synthase
MAKEAGLAVGDLIITLGDAHLYLNHLDQARRQLTREPYPFPTIGLAPGARLFGLEEAQVTVEGYRAHPAIRAPIAI